MSLQHYFEHRHIETQATGAGSSTATAVHEDDHLLPEQSETSGVKLPQRINVLHIARDIWVWILAVFFNFLVTLAIFPALTVLARSTQYGQVHIRDVTLEKNIINILFATSSNRVLPGTTSTS